jgi:hypothetical protein
LRARSALLILLLLGATATAAQAASKPASKYDGTYHLKAPRFPAKITVDCSKGYHTVIPIPVRAMNIHVRNGMLNGHRIDKFGGITILSHGVYPVDGVAATASVREQWSFGFSRGDIMSFAVHIMGKATGKDGTCSITGSSLQSGRLIGP